MITVIIPVYNSSSTLEQCINSILLQSYADIEIIIVNDGSSDNSRDICAMYSEKYGNILTIDSAHIGVSGARNLGLEMAKGEFIAFCDADDIYLPDAFISMLKAINNTDAVIGGVIKRNTPLVEDVVISADEAISRFFSGDENRILGTVYGKLFRRNLIGQNITFNMDVSIGEDSEFLLRYLFNCKSVSLISTNVYLHFENPSGIICASKKSRYESAILASKKMINYIIDYQDRSHLEEAIQDLFNVFALIIIRMKDLSWGARIFTSVISIIDDINTGIELSEINIYSHSKCCREMSTKFTPKDNNSGTYHIQWPTSLALMPMCDNKYIQVDESDASLSCQGSKYNQYLIIDHRDVLDSSNINAITYLGVVHFENLY